MNYARQVVKRHHSYVRCETYMNSFRTIFVASVGNEGIYNVFCIYFTNRVTDFGPLCIKDPAGTSYRRQSSSTNIGSQLILYREIMAESFGYGVRIG